MPAGSDITPVQGPGPFAFGDEGFVTEVLSGAGFVDVRLEPFAAPVVMGGGTGLDAAFAQCSGMSEARRILAALDDESREEARRRLRDMLADHLVDGAVQLGAVAWVVTARR